MHSLQFNQLNEAQKVDAIKQMAALSRELDVPVLGSRSEEGIKEAVQQDASPDAEFIFVELSEHQIEVKYRENI